MILKTANLEEYYSECFRTIKANIKYSDINKRNKIILVSSSKSGDGTTTVAYNLSSAFAEDKKVLLLEANLRNPILNKLFKKGEDTHLGLTNVLFNEVKIEQAIYKHSNNLHILFAGAKAVKPGEVLDSDIFVDLLNNLKEKYDYIILDSTALGLVADTQYLIQKVDGVVLVVNNNKTSKDSLKYLGQIIEKTKGTLLGVVVNNVKDVNRGIQSYY